MIAVIQRVKNAKVEIKGKTFSEIGKGYLILLGILKGDTDEDCEKMTKKIVHLRIMPDEKGKMNKNIIEAEGEILVVSQFTLAADLTAGRRPSFINAEEPEKAKNLYKLFVEKLKSYGIQVKTGKFGEYMQVILQNDGPVTIIADSKKL